MGETPRNKPPLTEEGARKPSRETDTAGWYKLAGIGFEFIAAIAVFTALGWFLDGRFGTSPWLLMIGFFMGFAAGLWIMYKAARKTFE